MVLVLLLAFCALQAGAVIVDHQHPDGHSQSCLACHVGHLLTLKTVDVINLTLPNEVTWHCRLHDYQAIDEDPLFASPSRAPPA